MGGIFVFEYCKNIVNDEIELDMKRYDEHREIKDEVQEKLNRLFHFQEIKFESKVNKVRLAISSIFLISSAGLAIFISSFFLGVVALLSLLKTIQCVKHVTEDKIEYIKNHRICLEIAEEVLKKDLSNLELTREMIKEVEKHLRQESEKIDSKLDEIMNSISKNNQILDHLEDYETACENFTKTGAINLKDVKSAEDLSKVRRIMEICRNNSLETYLSEDIDYSNIHFDNNIGDSINYTESSKKLIKKM